jgi:hypothetical protein
VEEARRVVVVGITATVEINLPVVLCDNCGADPVYLHALEWGVLPATPAEPGTFFTLDLLQLVQSLVMKAGTSFHGLTEALSSLQLNLGLPPRHTKEHLWRNLLEAWLHLSAVTENLQTARLGMLLRLGGKQCVACSRVLRGLVGDCCMGMVHSEKAGTASEGIKPRLSGLFLSDDKVRIGNEQYVQARGGAEAARKVDNIACGSGNHRAVVTDRAVAIPRRPFADRGGLGAIFCHHMQARSAVHRAPTTGEAVVLVTD